MPKRKYRSTKKYSPERTKGLETDKVRNKREKTMPKMGSERKVHEEIINRRIEGGIKLSEEELEEAYARALDQWLKLPGSVVKAPTDVLPIHTRLKSRGTVDESEESGKSKEAK